MGVRGNWYYWVMEKLQRVATGICEHCECELPLYKFEDQNGINWYLCEPCIDKLEEK